MQFFGGENIFAPGQLSLAITREKCGRKRIEVCVRAVKVFAFLHATLALRLDDDAFGSDFNIIFIFRITLYRKLSRKLNYISNAKNDKISKNILKLFGGLQTKWLCYV